MHDPCMNCQICTADFCVSFFFSSLRCPPLLSKKTDYLILYIMIITLIYIGFAGFYINQKSEKKDNFCYNSNVLFVSHLHYYHGRKLCIHEPPPSERNRVLSKLPWHHIYIVDMTVALHKPRQTHFLLVTNL
jgi:hypothetical protein